VTCGVSSIIHEVSVRSLGGKVVGGKTRYGSSKSEGGKERRSLEIRIFTLIPKSLEKDKRKKKELSEENDGKEFMMEQRTAKSPEQNEKGLRAVNTDLLIIS